MQKDGNGVEKSGAFSPLPFFLSVFEKKSCKAGKLVL